MKKKLLVIALIILAISLTFAIAASAETKETAPTISIEAFNLTFGNAVYIDYAVSAENVPAGATVELLIFDSYSKAFVKGNEFSVAKATTTTTTQNGKNCTVYVFDDIVTRQMATDFYAVVYVKSGSNEYYSAPEKYSVLQYVYNKVGYTSKNSSDSPTYKNLLKEALEFGAKAQEHFEPENTRIANGKFQQIVAENATLPDGFSKGLYLPGDTVTLTANEAPDGYVFSHWTDSNGANVGSESTLNVEVVKTEGVTCSTYTYTAVYKLEDATSSGFTLEATKDGTTYYFTEFSSKALQTTTDKSAATTLYLEKIDESIDNQYRVYYMNGDTKVYFGVSTSSTDIISSMAEGDYFYIGDNGILMYYRASKQDNRFMGLNSSNAGKAYASSSSQSTYPPLKLVSLAAE